MRTIYFFYTEDEYEGFFELVAGKLVMLHCWCANDACWRDEYFGPLLKKLSVQQEPLPKKYDAKALRMIEKYFGTGQDSSVQRCSRHTDEDCSPRCAGRKVV